MRPARRLDFIDIAKGVGILAVIAIHSSNRSVRTFTAHGDTEWWVLVIFNRLMAFAVPTFLSVSAFLWAKGAVGKKASAASVWRRVSAILYPYLIWTAIFMAWTIYADDTPASKVVTVSSLYTYLLWGKAYFHLYFLSILIQAAIVFPLFLLVIRRSRFVVTCIIAFAAQAAVFWLQSRFEFLRFPGSSFLWYVTNFIPAAWLGFRWPLSVVNLRRLLTPSVVLGVLGGAVYLWQQILDARHLKMSSPIANGSQQVFVFGAAFALIAYLAMKDVQPDLEDGGSPTARKPVKDWLVWLGASSLPLYLLHPMIMRFLGGPHVVGVLKKIPGAPFWSYLLLVVGTILVALILRATRLDKLLFGRVTNAIPKRPRQSP